MNIMKIGPTINWRIALLIITVTSMSSPYISQMYRGYVGLTFILAVLFFLVFLYPIGNYFTAIVGTAYRANKVMFFSLMWFIVGIVVTYLRGANDISFLIQVLFLPVFFFLGLFLSQNNRYRSFTIFSIIVFCFFNILFAGSSIGPTTSARDIYIESNQKLFSGTSGFWGLIGIFFPVFLVEVIKQKKIVKWIFILVLLTLLYKLLFSGFATPVALFLISFALIGIIYFLSNLHASYKGLKSFFVIIIFSGIVYFLFNTILSSESQGMLDIQGRFTNFIENPLGGGYSESQGISRFKLMRFSWDTFLNNPLFGKGGNIRTSIYEGISGGHSSAVDFLGVLGLIGGGGAFLYFVYLASRNAFRQMKSSKSFTDICNFVTVITFVIGGIMNPYWADTMVAMFLLVANIYNSQIFQYEF